VEAGGRSDGGPLGTPVCLDSNPRPRYTLAASLKPAGSVMPVNRSMPSAVVIPVLGYADVAAAAAWLCEAFGFERRLSIGDHRVQLTIDGGGAVVVTQRSTDAATTNHAIMVRVTDIDRHYRRALQRGALSLRPPADFMYGERQYSARDPGGHEWTFSQTIADVDPVDWGGILHRPSGGSAAQDKP
jgi:uncharacterized glyoxalase superfamily protein PhnB